MAKVKNREEAYNELKRIFDIIRGYYLETSKEAKSVGIFARASELHGIMSVKEFISLKGLQNVVEKYNEYESDCYEVYISIIADVKDRQNSYKTH